MMAFGSLVTEGSRVRLTGDVSEALVSQCDMEMCCVAQPPGCRNSRQAGSGVLLHCAIIDRHVAAAPVANIADLNGGELPPPGWLGDLPTARAIAGYDGSLSPLISDEGRWSMSIRGSTPETPLNCVGGRQTSLCSRLAFDRAISSDHCRLTVLLLQCHRNNRRDSVTANWDAVCGHRLRHQHRSSAEVPMRKVTPGRRRRTACEPSNK